jgi:5-methylcytosine-specific restriction endonuclease McrA
MGKARTPPFAAYPEWSEAKFWAFLRSGLRAKWTRWPPKYEVLRKAKRPYIGDNKRQKHEFQCASCAGWFPQKSVTVDHIIPAGQLRSWEDLPGFAERLFCSADGLQVLCDVCHLAKTKEERA